MVKVMRISFHFYAVDSGMMTAEMLNNVPDKLPHACMAQIRPHILLVREEGRGWGLMLEREPC